MLKTYLEVVLIFLILCVVLFAGSLVTIPLGLVGSAFTELVMLAVVIVACRIKKQPLGQRFPMDPPKLRPALTSIWIAVGFYFLVLAANCLTSAFDLTNTTDLLLYENYMPGSSPVLVVLCIVIVPAFCEEFLFRGVVLSNLMPYGKGTAIIVISVPFGLMHGNFYQFLYYLHILLQIYFLIFVFLLQLYRYLIICLYQY